jgi:hypothetical protein
MNTSGRRLALVAVAAACWAGYLTASRSQATPAPIDQLAADLAAIRAIAADALRVVRMGNVAQAKARVEQIEVMWRPLQTKVRAVSPAKWRAIDSALDRAERELRFWRVRRSDSGAALQDLIDAIDARA